MKFTISVFHSGANQYSMITYSSAPPAMAAATYPAGVASVRRPERITWLTAG